MNDLDLFENSILYKMCSDYPDHKDIEHIRGKITIIGRTYAASIERKAVNWTNRNGDLRELCKKISESTLDKKFKKSRNLIFSKI